MEKQIKHNKGFSLIELLIAMTIFSIVMVMVVQFMSTTSGAYRKTRKNLTLQTEAMQVMGQMSDTIMQATYIRLDIAGDECYTIKRTERDKTNERIIGKDSDGITWDFVPENYGNYAVTGDLFGKDREVILHADTYELLDRKLSGSDYQAYPLDTDADYHPGDNKVRSFRMLRDAAGASIDVASGDVVSPYRYVIPEYIYVEYSTKDKQAVSGDPSGAVESVTKHIIYYFKKDAGDENYSVYIYRYEAGPSEVASKGFNYAKAQVVAQANAGDGLLTDMISDFYVSADAEGNAILTDVLFMNNGYEYNAVQTINFRNSNMMTARPQKSSLYTPASSTPSTTPSTTP